MIVKTTEIAAVAFLVLVLAFLVAVAPKVFAVVPFLEQGFFFIEPRTKTSANALGLVSNHGILDVVNDQPVSGRFVDWELKTGVSAVHGVREENSSVGRVELEECSAIGVPLLCGSIDLVDVEVAILVVLILDQGFELLFDVLSTLDIKPLIDEVDCIFGGCRSISRMIS